YIQPYLGMDWLEIPWFFAEHYFYCRVLEATGYYQPGPGQRMDPFRLKKSAGLRSSIPAICRLAETLEEIARGGWQREAVQRLIYLDLWGNTADLSRWPGSQKKPDESQGRAPQRDRILVDDSPAAANLLFAPDGQPERVDFLLDNSGFELACDLVLAAALLESGSARQVQLHVKSAPVFVSDAMEKDVLEAAAFLAGEEEASIQRLGRRLQAAIDSSTLLLREDPFWTSPLSAWEMPAELFEELGQSRCILAKGDANYRRLLGDRHWDPTVPMNQVLCYLPAPLLALRTLKSEVAAGLQPGQAESAAQADPQWMDDGQWALIQLVRDRWE
ncbi:MAG TPA: damage-control phosphatase ARMT1 family protein, partial [Anaerolineaceae bacterium]